MITVRLDPEMEERLKRLAKDTGRSKSYYVKQAIENYLEDKEDYLLALAVLEKNEPRKSITEVRKELGLEHRINTNG
jgi:RHH-type rel operon transcriptional repressor/antitoxin RelB